MFLAQVNLKISMISVDYVLTYNFQHLFRLLVDKSTKGLTAKVQHYTGKIVLESSTTDLSFAQHIYKPYDTSAFINFGRVISFDKYTFD